MMVKTKNEKNNKVEKILDFVADEICPAIILGCSTFLIGYFVGGNAEYKRGFNTGVVSGASLAYSHVIETLKTLKP